MCLATVVNINQPDSIVLEYVSKIEVNGNQITLTDVMGCLLYTSPSPRDS